MKKMKLIGFTAVLAVMAFATLSLTACDGPDETNRVSTPTTNIPAGNVPWDTQILLGTTTVGATIYYTTDGNDPTVFSSVYSSSSNIRINTPRTIKAFAVATGMTASAVMTAEYTPICTDTTGHNYGSWTTTTPATCTTAGSQTRTCSRCSETEQQVISINPSAHSYGSWAVTTAGTCTAQVVETRSCSVCSGTDQRNFGVRHTFTTGMLNCTICSNPAVPGDTGPGGGIIFHVVPAGFTVGGYTGSFASYTAHYLEAAPENSGTAQWGAYGTLIPGVSAFNWDDYDGQDSIGNGRKDTLAIVAYLAANTTETGRAAQLAAAATFGGQNDWFLPSSGELNLLYQQRNLTGIGITSGYFWSSSQGDDNYAWIQGFIVGNRNYYFKGYYSNVRAVRAF